ncbi:MAG: hypothetical protein ACR2KP_04710, partial [Egibacteraceae bacterium]
VLALVSVGDDEGQDQADPETGRLQDLQMQVESLRERIGDLPGELAGDQEQPPEDTGPEDQLRDRIDELKGTVRDLGRGGGEEKQLRDRIDELEDTVRNLGRGGGEDTPSAPSVPDAAP